jgi:hypothetical protein
MDVQPRSSGFRIRRAIVGGIMAGVNRELLGAHGRRVPRGVVSIISSQYVVDNERVLSRAF